eukprot:1157351-Pelagomonas_calceolata.AAC.1
MSDDLSVCHRYFEAWARCRAKSSAQVASGKSTAARTKHAPSHSTKATPQGASKHCGRAGAEGAAGPGAWIWHTSRHVTRATWMLAGQGEARMLQARRRFGHVGLLGAAVLVKGAACRSRQLCAGPGSCVLI